MFFFFKERKPQGFFFFNLIKSFAMHPKLVSNSRASCHSVKLDKQIVYLTLAKVNNISDTQAFILKNNIGHNF